jgi:MoxR-like ATPase
MLSVLCVLWRVHHTHAVLQVAAYCNGRDKVSEYDCLLLEHILWQKPEHAPRIADWLLEQLSADDGNKQIEFLLSGLFARTCKALGSAGGVMEELKVEVSHLRGLLQDQLLAVSQNLEGEGGRV